MAMEAARFGTNAENNIVRAQERGMTLGEVAKGYEKAVEGVLASPAAAAIRHEVRKFADAIETGAGSDQYEHLGDLVKALDPYKKFFGGVWEDESERAPFALALVRREKSLQ